MSQPHEQPVTMAKPEKPTWYSLSRSPPNHSPWTVQRKFRAETGEAITAKELREYYLKCAQQNWPEDGELEVHATAALEMLNDGCMYMDWADSFWEEPEGGSNPASETIMRSHAYQHVWQAASLLALGLGMEDDDDTSSQESEAADAEQEASITAELKGDKQEGIDTAVKRRRESENAVQEVKKLRLQEADAGSKSD